MMNDVTEASRARSLHVSNICARRVTFARAYG
jgi:hypothetical protein